MVEAGMPAEPDPHPTLRRLLDEVRAARSEGRPSLLRLVGEGAAAAAAALCAGLSVRPVRQLFWRHLPEDGALVWLHDAPGGAAYVDVLVALASLDGRGWTVVSTGSAADGGHPALVQTHRFDDGSVEEGDGAVGIEPSALEMHLPDSEDALAHAVRSHIDAGDVLVAHAAWEALRAVNPERAAGLRGVRVARWVGTSRLDDVFERLPEMVGPLDDPARSDIHRVVGEVCRVTGRVGLAVRLMGPADPATVARRRGTPLDAPLAERDRLLWAGRFSEAVLPHREVSGPDPVVDLLHLDNGRQRLWRAEAALRDGEPARVTRILLGMTPEARERHASAVARLEAEAAVMVGDPSGWRAGLAEARDLRTLSGPARCAILDRTAGSPPLGRAAMLAALLDGASEPVRGRIRAALTALEPRPILLGGYVLTEPIGRGGTATVWRGTDVAFGRPVAVKVLRSRAGSSVSWGALFTSEIALTTRLSHPGIVAVQDFGTIDEAASIQSGGAVRADDPYLVMELVEGGSLSNHLGVLDEPRIRELLGALLDALAYAHGRGIVHRDVKPSNVLLTGDGEVRLADFGLAGLTDETAGTPAYMAPEQFEGGGDSRADLYGVGLVAWALCTGVPPFLGSAGQLRSAHAKGRLPSFEPLIEVSEELEAFVRRLLARDPQDRFDSAWAARAALDGRESERLLVLPPRQAYRLRPPTASLLRRGDPEPVGQHAACTALLDALEEAMREGIPRSVALLDPFEVGRDAILRWVVDQVRTQGIELMRTVVPGKPALVVDPETRAVGDRTLVVWTRRMAGVPTIELVRPGLLEICLAIRQRVPVAPEVAVLAGLRSVRRPGLAMAILEGWRESPGFAPSRAGLVLRREPGANPVAGRWWRAWLTRRSPGVRRALSVASVLEPGFAWETLVELCAAAGESPPPQDVLQRSDGVYTVPPELAEVVGSQPGTARHREDHAFAASIPHRAVDGALRRAAHAVFSGDPTAAEPIRTEVIHAMTRRVGFKGALPSLVQLDALELATLRHLRSPRDRVLLRWVALARARHRLARDPDHALESIEAIADRTDAPLQRIVARALALFARAMHPDTGAPDLDAVRTLWQAVQGVEDLQTRVWCGITVADALSRQGDPQAEAIWEQVVAWAEASHDPASRSVVAISRIQADGTRHPDTLDRFDAAIDWAARAGESAVRADVGHARMQALQLVGRSALHRAQGRLDAAREDAEQAVALAPTHPAACRSLFGGIIRDAPLPKLASLARTMARQGLLQGLAEGRFGLLVMLVLGAAGEPDGPWSVARWEDVASVLLEPAADPHEPAGLPTVRPADRAVLMELLERLRAEAPSERLERVAQLLELPAQNSPQSSSGASAG